MSQRILTKLKAAKASEVCQHFDIKEEVRKYLENGPSPGEFIDLLLADKHYAAAIGFMAHALAARDAVWWGCLCLRHACGSELAPAEEAACKAAVQWVLDPTEDNRAAAQAPGEKAGLGTPAGGLAMAATWTGGSLAPPSAPKVPPGPFVPAKAIAGAVVLTAVKGDPIRIGDTQRLFVELAVGIAEGRVTWPDIEKLNGQRNGNTRHARRL
jgi:hypothetical protein